MTRPDFKHHSKSILCSITTKAMFRSVGGEKSILLIYTTSCTPQHNVIWIVIHAPYSHGTGDPKLSSFRSFFWLYLGRLSHLQNWTSAFCGKGGVGAFISFRNHPAYPRCIDFENVGGGDDDDGNLQSRLWRGIEWIPVVVKLSVTVGPPVYSGAVARSARRLSGSARSRRAGARRRLVSLDFSGHCVDCEWRETNTWGNCTAEHNTNGYFRDFVIYFLLYKTRWVWRVWLLFI